MTGIYPKIIKQAFYLTRSQRLFWKSGLFLVWPNLVRSLLAVGFVAAWFEWGAGTFMQEQEAAQGNPWIGLGALLAIGLLLIFYFRHKAVVVLAVKQLQSKSQIDREKLYAETDPHVASFIKFSLISTLTFGVVVLLLTSPVFYLSADGYDLRAGILGFLAVLVGLPIVGLIYCAMIFGPMFMAVHHLSAWDSARTSIDIFRGNWLFLSGLWFVLLAFEFISLIFSLAVMLLAMLPFVLLIQIFYDSGGPANTILQALAGVLGFVVFFMSQAVVAALQRVAWAVVFFEIVRPVKKLEEEEPETMPEIIS